MSRTRIPFTRSGIDSLPDDKPVNYTIETEGGRPNYHGVAQRGRVHDRLAEHLPGAKDAVPGAMVSIQPAPSIDKARTIERARIAEDKPRYNKQGK